MDIRDLLDELNLQEDDRPVYVEFNGVAHSIHSVTDDSQGVYIVVDEAIEERTMR